MHRYVRNATKLLRKTIYGNTIQNIRKIELYIIFLFSHLVDKGLRNIRILKNECNLLLLDS